jgi:hypothetical protein
MCPIDRSDVDLLVAGAPTAPLDTLPQPTHYPTKPCETRPWTSAGGSRNLGLGKCEAAFRDNAIDEQGLRHLTAEDLQEIGVAAVGDRRKLLAAIAELAAPSPSAEPRSPPSAAERPKTLRPRPSGVRSQAELGKVSAPRFEMCGLRR